jgi:hypothetical protein
VLKKKETLRKCQGTKEKRKEWAWHVKSQVWCPFGSPMGQSIFPLTCGVILNKLMVEQGGSFARASSSIK